MSCRVRRPRREWLRTLADRAEHAFEVVPVRGYLDIAPDVLRHMNEMLGAETYAAIQVARAEHAALWADDLVIRELARVGLSLDGFSSVSSREIVAYQGLRYALELRF